MVEAHLLHNLEVQEARIAVLAEDVQRRDPWNRTIEECMLAKSLAVIPRHLHRIICKTVHRNKPC